MHVAQPFAIVSSIQVNLMSKLNMNRQLRFNGDIVTYISDLAEITFRLIRNTCDWYGGSFREAAMASGIYLI